MPTYRCLQFLLCLIAALPTLAQSVSEQVTVDSYLTLSFPGRVTHFDSLDITLFQSMVDQTTYQVVKRAHVFEQASQEEQAAMIDQVSRQPTGQGAG